MGAGEEAAAALRPADVGLRWTMGDVSERGFEALRLSVWGAWQVFGPRARYAVCINSLPASEARGRTGPLPPAVVWHEVSRELPDFLAAVFGQDMAEGVAWKLVPLRVFPDAWEISLDNDCILWELPPSMARWLAQPEGGMQCLMAEDVRACYGQFAAQCPREARNAGIRGIPPGFDLASALREVISQRQHPLVFTSELDEQGLQVAALSLHQPLAVVSLEEVTVCSPFHPHLPHLGRCGAHFVGLNARHIPWAYFGRAADAWMGEFWGGLRGELVRLTGCFGARSGSPPARG